MRSRSASAGQQAQQRCMHDSSSNKSRSHVRLHRNVCGASGCKTRVHRDIVSAHDCGLLACTWFKSEPLTARPDFATLFAPAVLLQAGHADPLGGLSSGVAAGAAGAVLSASPGAPAGQGFTEQEGHELQVRPMHVHSCACVRAQLFDMRWCGNVLLCGCTVCCSCCSMVQSCIMLHRHAQQESLDTRHQQHAAVYTQNPAA
jgi:hypothetical protein